MTRHDGVDAAALAGCDPGLLRSTRLAGGDVLPAQVRSGGRAERLLGGQGACVCAATTPSCRP